MNEKPTPAGGSAGKDVRWTLLVLFGGMFIVEVATGWLGESMGLMADGLDMSADAAV